jgi:ligand-binding sensor domain-containing protein
MKAFLLLSLLVFLLLPSSSLANNHEYVIERIQHPDLVPGFIASIAQDHDGFLWIATSDGLYRYDGVRFVVYKSEVRNPSSLPNNNIRKVFLDSFGNIWVLTQGGGLSGYNRQSNDFTTFVPSGDFPSSVTGTFDFWSLHQADNDLYISAHGGDGFFRFNIDNQTFTRVELPATNQRHFIQTSVLIKTRNGSTWVGTDESGILVLSLDGSFKRFSTDEGNLNSDRIRAILEAADGTVWVGTISGGLHRFNQTSLRAEQNQLALSAVPGLNSASVYSLLQDNRGNIWIASSIGLIVFNPNSDVIVNHYRYDPANPRSLSSDRVRSIYLDRSGVFWVGTHNGGLNKLTLRQNFTNIKPASSAPDGVLNNATVRAISKFRNELWIGTEGGGINILDPVNYQLNRVITTESTLYTGLQSNEITMFTHDPDGGLWLGTWGGGLHYFNPVTSRFVAYRHDLSDSLSISDDRIQFLHLDSTGDYWVGTENGLNRFHRETASFHRIKHDPDNPASLTGNSLQTLGFIERSPGIFWVASWQGLNLYNANTGNAQRFISDSINPNTLSTNNIISLHKDDENLWIGTFGGGLNRLNTYTGDIDYFTELTGLPNNVIFSILEDNNGYLWMSSSRGLSKFDRKALSFVNYTESDGIQGNDFWWGCVVIGFIQATVV